MGKLSLVSAALLWLSFSTHAETLRGRVVAIADGDTLTILDSARVQHKVRLSGIDAPEKRQAFGNVSRQNLSRMVFGQPVTVNYDKRDRYGRIVGKILLSGADVNIEQVKAGLAWHYKKYQKEQPVQDRGSYANAEEAARGSRLGLWRDASPVPPWEFRSERRYGFQQVRPVVPYAVH